MGGEIKAAERIHLRTSAWYLGLEGAIMALGLLVFIPLSDSLGVRTGVLDVILAVGGGAAIALAWAPEVLGRSLFVDMTEIRLPSGTRIGSAEVHVVPYGLKKKPPRNLDGLVVSVRGQPATFVPLMLTQAQTRLALARLAHVLGQDKVEPEPRWVGPVRLPRRRSMMLAQVSVFAVICGLGAGYFADRFSLDYAIRLSVISLVAYMAFIFRSLRVETERLSVRAATAAA